MRGTNILGNTLFHDAGTIFVFVFAGH